MGIWIDAHHASGFERLSMPTPVQIQAPRICVDLDCNAVLCARSQDFFYIDFVAWPSQELATGHMAKDRGTRIRYGRKDAFGLLRAAELEPAVHARNDKLKAGKDFVWIVQRAVRQDV